ncbi:HEPN domain-containing protein [Candidatus Magnetomoraceae bacterium gMMP-15]
MNMKNKIEYWLDVAFYDLETACAMLQTKRFLYVGFMCHQVVEKCLKAYYWHNVQNEPPYTHNLLILSEKSGFDKKATEDNFLLFNELMPLNIQARYPEDKEMLLKELNDEKCRQFYSKTESFYKWMKILLK